MKLVYLGTSGAMPQVKRGLSCTVLAMDHQYIMVDCGDGACRQFLTSNLKWNKPMTILFTHAHSDHTIGILGFLQSASLMNRTAPIKIYGFKGIKNFITQLHRNQQVKFSYDFEVIEVTENDVIVGDGFTITCCDSKHSIKPSLAYRIQLPNKAGELDINRCLELGVPQNSPLLGKLKAGQDVFVGKDGKVRVRSNEVVGKPQKGKVVCFSGDTRPTEKLKEFYKDADYLTHEATFLEDEKDIAEKHGHSTAYEAGLIANQARVKHTILNHFSARHPSSQPSVEEASKMNPNVVGAEDFMEIEID